MFNHILIVCIGNICRSPMAQGLFTHALQDKPNYTISSAGLGALVGKTPDKTACELMQEKGIDIHQNYASQLNIEMIKKADIILVMDTHQKNLIAAKAPSAKGKIFRLGKWDHVDIPDPYQKDLTHFKNTLQLIEQGVNQWVQRL